MRTRPLGLLLLFCALSCVAIAEQSFWARHESANEGWHVYRPTEDGLKGQATLIYTTLEKSDPGLDIRLLLQQMYSELDQFTLLGQKDTSWGEAPAKLLSFKARLGEGEFLGRTVVCQTAKGVEVLLLLRHPKAHSKIVTAFETARKTWPNEQPTGESK